MTSLSDPVRPVRIIADDLTSAADGAAPFLPGAVHLARGAWADGAVVALDCDSRAAPVKAAVARVSAAAAQVPGEAILLKTVDSTLRGHVREEIAACFAASGRARIVMAPAFPAAGRVTRGGVQYVDGVPVDRSPYGADAVHPVRSADIMALMGDIAGPVRLCRADQAPTAEAGAIVLDCADQAALDRWIARLPSPETCLFVGSPGLAIALGRRFGGASAAPASQAPRAGGLVVVGSGNPVSQRQAAALADLPPGWRVLTAPADPGDPRAILARLADTAAAHIRATGPGTLIATGGETMAAILDRLGISRMRLTGEIEPGFPLCEASFNGRPLALAMKAGGFGGPDVLARAMTRLCPISETE
ncbi:four-carbon acid sugar kinase family protein [Pseudooceanicola sp. C21-150M6]|uniref:four-carbon acid sugar kinase family protein n=1 Tax=Pseudooceanicola sp. C21-150M6 TaxID=3434355 RepID=UPI003D7F2450